VTPFPPSESFGPPRAATVKRRGFTLVEMLVAMSIVTLMLVMLLTISNNISATWKRTAAKTEQFREARMGFEAMTRRLSQATLNTYWDYDNPAAPTRYIRQSELRFISGPANSVISAGSTQRFSHCVFFQAPLGFTTNSAYSGLENLLNTWGYYVEWNNDDQQVPDFIATAANRNAQRRWRFRLMEFMQPADQMNLYHFTSGLTSGTSGTPKNNSYTGTDWFSPAVNATPPPAYVLAENIVALVILPKLAEADQQSGGYNDASLAPNYLYDSTGKSMSTTEKKDLNPTNQLPPVVQVTIVAVDEVSMIRYLSRTDPANNGNAPSLPIDNYFSKADQYDRDLLVDPTDGSTSLSEVLIGEQLNYRVFTTSVVMKGAKWSREQEQ
jgi:uncharacterized protein (TIGR02599 family)